MILNARETATILVGLRRLQDDIEREGLDSLNNDYPQFDETPCLDLDQINDLCEKVNVVEDPADKKRGDMRRFLAQLTVRNGEYEHTESLLVSATTQKKADKILDRLCAKYYGNNPDRDGDSYYFDCGCVCVTPGSVQEISDTTFFELNRNGLTNWS